jgi:hypothetical protein
MIGTVVQCNMFYRSTEPAGGDIRAATAPEREADRAALDDDDLYFVRHESI